MLWPHVSVFQEVVKRVPKTLVGAQQIATCRELASTLPSIVSSTYFECRLDDNPQVDYLILLTDRARAASSFEQRLDSSHGVAWERNLSLLRAWGDITSPLHEAPLVWFEYDIESGHVPEPSPSVGLERGYFSRFSRGTLPSGSETLELARAALVHVVAVELHSDVNLMITDCVQKLPTGGALIYLSSMITRRPNVIKLYVSVPKNAVLQYLADIAWPGLLEDAQNVLTTCYGPVTETVFLDLSIHGRVLPRIGFALSQFHAGELRDFDPAWSWMTMPGVADNKREGLRSWPGISETTIDGLRTWVHRWVDIKTVLNDTGHQEFKAYLGFMPDLPPPFA